MNAQFYRECEIVSLLLRATTWVPDLALGSMAASWEAAWLPKPIEGIADHTLALAIDLATLAHAVHAGDPAGGPAAGEAHAHDPFAMALRRIEFESGRLMQAQIHVPEGPRPPTVSRCRQRGARKASRRGAQAVGTKCLQASASRPRANDRE